MAVSVDTVAFSGVRAIESRPVLLFGLAGGVFVWRLVTLLVIWGLGAASSSGSGDFAWAVGLGTSIFSGLLGLAVLGVFLCAIFRAVLTPQDRAFGYLRFGADEGRMFLLLLVLALLYVLGGVVVGWALRLMGAGYGFGSLQWLISLGLLFGLCVVNTRLSLAAPMTFMDKRLRLFDSWRATRQEFWRLFGAYLLIWGAILVLGLILSILLAMAFGAAARNGMGAGLFDLMRNPSLVGQTGVSLGLIVAEAVRSLVGAAVLVLVQTPTAAAYDQVVGADVSKVF